MKFIGRCSNGNLDRITMQAHARQSESVRSGRYETAGRNYFRGQSLKRFTIIAALILVAYFVGFAPAWMMARGHVQELQDLKRQTRLSSLRAHLADAALRTRKGEFEDARQSTLDFYTRLSAEMNRDDSVITQPDREAAGRVLAERDEIVARLARHDSATADVFSKWYFEMAAN